MLIDSIARGLAAPKTRRTALGMALGTVAAVGLAQVGPKSAAAQASIEVHMMDCPADTYHLFETCHPSSFPVPTAVQSAELATFYIDPTYLTDHLGVYAYCRDLVSDTVLIDSREDDGVFSIELDETSNIVCDIYMLTEPTGEDVPDDGGVPALPDTGTDSSSTGMALITSATLIAGAAAVAGARLGQRKA